MIGIRYDNEFKTMLRLSNRNEEYRQGGVKQISRYTFAQKSSPLAEVFVGSRKPDIVHPEKAGYLMGENTTILIHPNGSLVIMPEETLQIHDVGHLLSPTIA